MYVERSVRVKNKTALIIAICCMLAAIGLMLTPWGAVMRFSGSGGPDNLWVRETYPYFSMLVLGYGNIYPMLTGLCSIFTTGILCIVYFANRLRIFALMFTLASAAFSILAITFFSGASIVSAVISFCLIGSAIFQLVPKKM